MFELIKKWYDRYVWRSNNIALCVKLDNAHPLTISELVNALYHVKTLARTHHQSLNFGICNEVSTALHAKGYKNAHILWNEIRGILWQDWDHFSGDKFYPIPSTDRTNIPQSAYIFHLHHNSLWSGSQGEFRYNLILHMIGKLRAYQLLHEGK